MFVFSVAWTPPSSKYFGTESARAPAFPRSPDRERPGQRLPVPSGTEMPSAAGTSGAPAPADHRQVELRHQAVGELAAGGAAAKVIDPRQQDRQLPPAHFDPGAGRQVVPAAPVAPQDRPLRLKRAWLAARAAAFQLNHGR